VFIISAAHKSTAHANLSVWYGGSFKIITVFFATFVSEKKLQKSVDMYGVVTSYEKHSGLFLSEQLQPNYDDLADAVSFAFY